MNEDELFDNGIDGELWAESDDQDDADWDERECSFVHEANGLEITAWPTYGNYVILTETFQIYFYPGARKLSIHDLRLEDKQNYHLHDLVLTLKNEDLSFFEKEKGGKFVGIYLTGEEVDKKVQKYINLKAFL